MEKPVAKPHKNYTKLPIESDPTRSSGLTQFGAESLQLLLAMKLNFTILKPGRSHWWLDLGGKRPLSKHVYHWGILRPLLVLTTTQGSRQGEAAILLKEEQLIQLDTSNQVQWCLRMPIFVTITLEQSSRNLSCLWFVIGRFSKLQYHAMKFRCGSSEQMTAKKTNRWKKDAINESMWQSAQMRSGSNGTGNFKGLLLQTAWPSEGWLAVEALCPAVHMASQFWQHIVFMLFSNYRVHHVPPKQLLPIGMIANKQKYRDRNRVPNSL